MGLLVSAKLLNVAVPFLFKYAVDNLNAHLDSPLHLSGDPQTAVLTTTFAILIGCKSYKIFQIVLIRHNITSFKNWLQTELLAALQLVATS